MNFNDKLKKFKEFYNIDFSLLGKTEIEQKKTNEQKDKKAVRYKRC